MAEQKKPKAVYEPGQLDRTRKNIGDISKEEALLLASKLGGEVGVEKTPTFEEIQKNKTYAKRRDKIQTITSTPVNNSTSTSKINIESNIPIRQRSYSLPNISSKEKALMDKLMASSEYQIKPNYGIFSFLLIFIKNGQEKVSYTFIHSDLKNFVSHFQSFITAIKALYFAGNDAYKAKVNQYPQAQYKAIKYINTLDLHEIEDLLLQLEIDDEGVTVTDLIPFVKLIYKPLITLYFLGEVNFATLIRNTYNEVASLTKEPQQTLMVHAKNATTEWLYLRTKVVKTLYPLLMRMCSTECLDFSTFFQKKIGKILQFLNLTKYDLILPDKENDKNQTPTPQPDIQTAEEATKPTEEEEIPEAEPVDETTEKEEISDSEKNKRLLNAKLISNGLDLLDKMFPEAGWLELTKHPDMFPYFQPLYSFKDGFNMLSPENPLQVTIILIRILGDFFQACRNIQFSIDKEPDYSSGDNLSEIFADWSLYLEVTLEKELLAELKDYVTHAYTQIDFRKTSFAKRQLSNFLWQVKYYFLPNLSFELVFMEKPDKDTTFKPFPTRVRYLKEIFNDLLTRIEQDLEISTNANDSNDKYGAANINAQYNFDIPNVVSKRIDVLLGGRKSRNLTNTNLLKYTLCVISVLDWWINNPQSPAYEDNITSIYRTSPDDGTPIFSVPTREDQNELFIKSIKARLNTKEKTN